LQRMNPSMALNRHYSRTAECPLSGEAGMAKKRHDVS
jgi:hypothetical protein